MKQDTNSGGQSEIVTEIPVRFFRRIDWIAGAICFLLAFGAYFFTLAPTVTLEDSGELAVASDYLGVPHPPGYPIWTLLTWLFQLVFHWVKYNGHPNPAWGVALGSGFFGAAACGLLALLISRTGSEMLESIAGINKRLSKNVENSICLVCAVSAGLMLAFSPVLWSQSTIVEVYSLNAFFLMLIVIFLYIWMRRPKDMKWMYALAFTFGLGLTNHQSLVFMGLPLVAAVFLIELTGVRETLTSFAILIVFALGLLTPFPWIFIAISLGIAMLLRKMAVFRDFVIVGLVMFGMFFTSGWMGQHERMALNWSSGPQYPGFWIWTTMAIMFPGLVAIPKSWRRGASFSLLSLLSLIVLNKLLLASAGDGEMLFWGGGPSQPLFWLWTVGAIVLALIPIFLRPKWCVVSLITVFAVFMFIAQLWAEKAGYTNLLINQGIVSSGFWIVTLTSLVFWLLIVYDIPNGRAVGVTFLLLELGVSFYAMMPLASDQNPPMNWGYPRTWKGFMHAVTRGQYEKISPLDNFHKILKDPVYFLRQNFEIIFDPKGYISVVSQFTAYIAALALIPFFFFRNITRKMRNWMIVTLVGFISMTTIFIIFQYPKLDIQPLFIGRVQYIQAHAICALWIGYGAIFALAGIYALSKRNRAFLSVGLLSVLLFPAVPILRNAFDQKMIDLAGSSDQQGHDFGWQFGYYQLTGAKGILEELDPEERAQYPNPAYPSAMGTNAVFFGGTDPGRFVPTYMIYSADVRPDVYLITQNALADSTYLNVMRDLYGNDIWIPSAQDSNMAFEEYIDAIRSGKAKAGADVSMEGGKVSVQGVAGVMQINAILARMIFEHNRYTQSPEITERFIKGENISDSGVRTVTTKGVERPVREFYVEESYAIPWMYPYMQPNGLIIKLNPQPIKLTEEMVDNDQQFWKWYSARLLGDKAFLRDVVARKTFSKLRSSLAGLYVYNKRYADAVTAFKQSIALYPLSPEANFRLASTYVRMYKLEDARETMHKFLEEDNRNEAAASYLDSIERSIKMLSMKASLESRLKSGEKLSIRDQLQLANIYIGLNEIVKFRSIACRFIGNDKMMPEAYLEIARLAAQAKDLDITKKALNIYTRKRPEDHIGWINLAATEVYHRNLPAVLTAVRKALDTGGEEARDIILKDKRFSPLFKNKSFQELMRPTKNKNAQFPIPQDLQKLLR